MKRDSRLRKFCYLSIGSSIIVAVGFVVGATVLQAKKAAIGTESEDLDALARSRFSVPTSAPAAVSATLGHSPDVVSLRSLYPEKLHSHHPDDRFKKIRVTSPVNAQYERSIAQWIESAAAGDYPEELTSGEAVLAGACPKQGYLRLGGTHDSKSPTGWMVCMPLLPTHGLRHADQLHQPYTGKCASLSEAGLCVPVKTTVPVPPQSSTQDCVVYSFGIGEEDTFEQHLAFDTHCTVHAFDPVPAVHNWIKRRDESVALLRRRGSRADVHASFNRILTAQGVRTPSWQSALNKGYYLSMAERNTDNPVRFHPWGLADSDFTGTLNNSWSKGSAKAGTFKTLQTIMEELGHQRVDILKLDIEGFEWGILSQILDPHLGIRQLMLEMHFGGAQQWIEALRAVKAAGFELYYSERLRYHGRGCKRSRRDPLCRGGLQEVSFVRRFAT
ncbi:hypothetical protein DIPPA_07036 [Diplonema papillatum]|nr:hypothetical protein DIPPA_07036 [Diplonema papillatum]